MEQIRCAVAAYVAFKKLQELKKRKRRFWVRKELRSRNETGFFITVYPKIKNDPEKFFAYTRMQVSTFHLLLNLLQDKLEKFSIRRPISPECRLFMTIMYLAHGGPRAVYSSKFQIGVTTLRRIIMQTCSAIWMELSEFLVKLPTTSDYQAIAEKYNTTNNIPNCVGAIDAKHINVACPPNSVSLGYKGKFSIVLLAVCDPDHIITNVDVGAYENDIDGGIFQQTEFGKMLLEKMLPLPEDTVLPNTGALMSHYFIGGSAFPLNKHLMRPFPERELSPEKETYNTRLSSARMTIENTFGVMASRWRLLQKCINAAPDNVVGIVKAIVVLHNFLKLNSLTYCPPEYSDRVVDGEFLPGQWHSNTTPLESISASAANRSSREALQFRNRLCTYFNT